VKAAAAPPAAPAGEMEEMEEEEKAPADEPAEEKAATSRSDAKKRAPHPVTIKTDPDGTRVTTGKHVFGTTPLTLKLRPGNSYEFTFSKAGYTTLSRKFRFDSDEPQTLRVTLKKAAPEPKKATPPPPPPAAKAPPPPPPSRKGFFAR
jgi:hypothetical protein